MMDFTVNYKIDVSENIEELAEKFARHLIAGTCFKNDFFTVALSGGSTPKIIYNYLAANYSTKIDWGKIKFFWSDERCVPPTNSDSNYKMTFDSLFSKIEIPKKNIFRIHGEKNPDEEALRYEKIILDEVEISNGLPCFDLMLLGLGEDGHTASIFPNHQKLFSSENIYVVAEHPVTKQKRITLTGTVINNSSKVIFLVTGESKNKMINNIINHKTGYEKLPASLVNPADGELIWLIDKAAASLLEL